MGPLDFAVEMGRSRCNWPEFDSPIHEALLNGFGKELATAVGLDALDRERHLLDDVIEKIESAHRRSSAIKAQDLVAAAIVDRSVLIDSGPDLADIHLDALPRDRPAVAPFALAPPPRPLEDLLVMPG
jgi:hypothetical protein